MSRVGSVLILSASMLFLSGCGGMTLPSFGSAPSVENAEHFIYQGHDFGPGRNADYRQGVLDGCKTAQGTYTKNHASFRNNEDYKAGWEHGRLHCKK